MFQANSEVEEHNHGEEVFNNTSGAFILLHALVGGQNYHNMRVVGMVGKKPSHILIDSGSTHNFLDLEYAKALGCEIEQIPPHAVAVALTDGNHIAFQYRCKDFSWKLQ